MTIPGTSGTVSNPGTSGTVSNPGTSGTSGTEQIPIDEMFIKNPTTKKCLQTRDYYPDAFGPRVTSAMLQTCNNTIKGQLWEYDKTNKTLSTPENKSNNRCLYLRNYGTITEPQFATCAPSNRLFQWEYNDETKQIKNVEMGQCLYHTNDGVTRGQACTRDTSSQQEWEFIDPYQ